VSGEFKTSMGFTLQRNPCLFLFIMLFPAFDWLIVYIKRALS